MGVGCPLTKKGVRLARSISWKKHRVERFGTGTGGSYLYRSCCRDRGEGFLGNHRCMIGTGPVEASGNLAMCLRKLPVYSMKDPFFRRGFRLVG